jgi:hypothetical protein
MNVISGNAQFFACNNWMIAKFAVFRWDDDDAITHNPRRNRDDVMVPVDAIHIDEVICG